MKVKNVIKGLQQQYDLKAIHIITPTKVLFSGDYSQWAATDVGMILYKRAVENLEVLDRRMFNRSGAFLFVPDLEEVAGC